MNDRPQCPEKATHLLVRKAKPEDAMDILCWRNDPFVRAMSRHREAISEEEHLAWYARAIEDTNRLLLIGILAGQKIGVVRFDRCSASLWEVSITLAPLARGQGLALHLLKMALEQLVALCAPVTVQAVVRLNNEPSLRLFRAMGFHCENNDGDFTTLTLTSGPS